MYCVSAGRFAESGGWIRTLLDRNITRHAIKRIYQFEITTTTIFSFQYGNTIVTCFDLLRRKG